MKKFIKDREVRKNIFTYSVTGIIIVSFFFILSNFNVVHETFDKGVTILAPFIWGLVIAFLLNGLNEKLCIKLKPLLKKHTRTICAIISVLTFMLAIITFIIILSPQLIASVQQLISNTGSYLLSFGNFVNNIADKIVLNNDQIVKFTEYAVGFFTKFVNSLQENIPNIIGGAYATVKGFISFIIGVIVAIYVLMDKENLLRTWNRLGETFLNSKKLTYIRHVIFISCQKFNSFIIGKLIDSLIIGVLTFFTMMFLKLDYAILISFVIGLTNIIPVFGPFIGAIPCGFILLIIDPIQCLIFMIMILIIQQIDGNIIGPFILGDSMGLSSFWVMFAIIVGGGFFGIIGMFIGVPLFSIIYHLLGDYVRKVEKEKELEQTIQN